AQFKAFNDVVNKMMGSNGSELTPEIVGAAKDVAGKGRGAVADRNTLVFDDQLNAGLDAIKQRAALELDPNGQAVVNAHVNNIMSKVGPDMTMPGTAWKGINTSLGKTFIPGTNIISDLQDTLEGAMGRSMKPGDMAEWNKYGHDYYNALQVGDATAATPGFLSPSKLLTQVNSYQRGARFGGGNDLAQLAQWAKSNLGDAIPNSGTAQREFYQKLFTTPLDSLAGLSAVGSLGMAPVVYGASRALAGQPASAFTKDALQRAGMTLGGLAAPRLLGSLQ